MPATGPTLVPMLGKPMRADRLECTGAPCERPNTTRTIVASTRYQAKSARCNFFGCDRPGVQYVAKQASRWMSKLCADDCEHSGGFRCIQHVFRLVRGDGVARA